MIIQCLGVPHLMETAAGKCWAVRKRGSGTDADGEEMAGTHALPPLRPEAAAAAALGSQGHSYCEHICVFPGFLSEHEHTQRCAQRRIPAPPRRCLRARAHRHAPELATPHWRRAQVPADGHPAGTIECEPAAGRLRARAHGPRCACRPPRIDDSRVTASTNPGSSGRPLG